MVDGKVVVVGCVKNSEQFLPGVFLNLEMFARKYEEVAYIFVENDSQDNTKQLVKDWGALQNNFRLICFDGLDAYEANRTVRLEIARNAYIHAVLSDPLLREYDEMIVMDMDDRGSYPLDPLQIEMALGFLRGKSNRAGIFANQLQKYYDLWALRHPEFCPYDFWHEVLKAAMHLTSDDEAFESVYSKIPDNFDRTLPPLQVESAFGGLGIYKLEFVKRNKSRYIGHKFLYLNENPLIFTKVQTCEHVSFNQGITAEGGELYVLPYLINSQEDTRFLASAFRTIVIR